jgi:hypothetical protein
LVHDRDLAGLPDRLELVGGEGEEVGAHVAREGLHHLEGGDAGLVVDRRRRRARLEELAAEAEVHVDELGREVPAGGEVPASGCSMALGADHLGGREDVLVGGRRLDAELLEMSRR